MGVDCLLVAGFFVGVFSSLAGVYIEGGDAEMVTMLEEAAQYVNISIQLPANYYFTQTILQEQVPNEMEAAAEGKRSFSVVVCTVWLGKLLRSLDGTRANYYFTQTILQEQVPNEMEAAAEGEKRKKPLLCVCLGKQGLVTTSQRARKEVTFSCLSLFDSGHFHFTFCRSRFPMRWRLQLRVREVFQLLFVQYGWVNCLGLWMVQGQTTTSPRPYCKNRFPMRWRLQLRVRKEKNLCCVFVWVNRGLLPLHRGQGKKLPFLV